LVSRLLTEFHVIDDRPVAAFDLADEGPKLADYLPELTTIADIGDTRGQMVFFDRLLADQDAAKIIDLSHRTFKNFFTIVQTIDFFEEARRHSIEPLILFVIAPDPKSPKAYASLREWFAAASFMPVRNQTAVIPASNGDASVNVSMIPDLIDIPIIGVSLKALVDRQSFSFAQFWRRSEVALPFPLDDELSTWLEHVFFQFRDLELWLTCEQTSTNFASPGSRPRRTTPATQQMAGNSQWNAEVVPIDQHSVYIPEEVLKFAPKKKRLIEGGAIDQFGPAILAMMQKIADLSNNDKAKADELSHQLQIAQDRISQLKGDVERFEDRAVRAETWLEHIRQQIEENLIASRTTDPTISD
jgi:hypothetical protein